MSMKEAEQAFELIENQKSKRFSGIKPDSLILKAQQALGITFPPTYRAFLSRYGCGHVAGEEFYGVVDDDFENSSVPDAVWLTLDERKSGTPNSLVIVASTGDGGYYAIDLDKKNNEEESPVVEWWPGIPNAEGNRRVVAADFGTFLLQQVRAAVS